MFFLIAGVSPKTRILDQNPRRCPVCGLSQAYYQRVDQYLNVFFIPVFRVKQGDPFIMCQRCESRVGAFDTGSDVTFSKPEKMCKTCGRNFDPDFSYCPYCGRKI